MTVYIAHSYCLNVFTHCSSFYSYFEVAKINFHKQLQCKHLYSRCVIVTSEMKSHFVQPCKRLFLQILVNIITKISRSICLGNKLNIPQQLFKPKYMYVHIINCLFTILLVSQLLTLHIQLQIDVHLMLGVVYGILDIQL